MNRVTIPEVVRLNTDTDERLQIDPRPLWTPSLLSPTAWYDAMDSSTITLGSIGVATWRDKSTNGNNMVQATGARQPIYVASDAMYGGRPSLYGNITHRFMTTAAAIPATKTIYMVLYYGTGVEAGFVNHNQIVGNPANINVRITGRTGGTTVWDGSNDFDESGDFKNGSTTNIKGVANSAVPMPSTIWRFEAASSWTQRWCVLGNTVNFTYWHGGVGEIVMTNGSEDITTKKKVEGYLAWKWGMVSKLPSDHPYKNIQPLA